MKTFRLFLVILWFSFVCLYSGIAVAGHYSTSTTFIWGGETFNVTAHSTFTDYQLKNPVYVDTSTGELKKSNLTISMPALEFRFEEGKVLDYYRVINPVNVPLLYSAQVWDEYRIDGDVWYNTYEGVNPMHLVMALWVATLIICGYKMYRVKKYNEAIL